MDRLYHKIDKKSNIVFRVDSSSSIGIGHIMRDLVLAKQYEKNGATIIFATQNLEGNLNSKITENGYEVTILKDNSLEEFQKIVNKYNPFLVVFDNYDIDEVYEKQFKLQNPNIKLMVLDDTYEAHYCDIVLNHNIYAKKEKYKSLVPSWCEIQCGENYTLLREEFLKEKELKREKIYDVFISYGGADTLSLNIPTLKLLEEINKDFKIVVITTKANDSLDELKEYVKNKKNIELKINTNEMAKLLNQTKLAIISPSVTMNEVWFLKTPFIAIKTASNQNYMVEFLKEKGYKVFENFNVKKLQNYYKNKLKEIK